METSETNFVKQYEPGTQARVELKNGRILDVINGRYYDAGTSIVLQEGKIVSMPGLAGEPAGIDADFTIDLQGKTVLPSLFNAHMHLATAGPTMIPSLRDQRLTKKYLEQQQEKNLADCLAHGVTHVRDAWCPDLRNNKAQRDRIARGEIPGPRILQAVAVGLPGSYLQEKLSMPMRVMGMEQVDTSKATAGSVSFPIEATEQQVRDAVDIAIDERGADAIKIGDQNPSMLTNKPVPTMTIEQLSIVADQARRRGVPSTMHHSTLASFRRGVEAGVSSLAHGPMDALVTPADVDAFKAAGCINDPTVSAFYAIFSWKLGKARTDNHPELERLTEFRNKTYTFERIADEYHIPELRASVMNSYRRCAAGKPRLLGIIDMSAMFAWSEKLAFLFENMRLLHNHGVPMTTGNDTMPPCTPAMVGLDLLMFDHVLKQSTDGAPFNGAEAVKIATINSARSLGLENEFGSIESGKTADLVILDGDPLEDFRLIGSRVSALFMDGKLVIDNCGLHVESNVKA